MARYRNVSTKTLNYTDSRGPWVSPGEVFTHDIPHAQLLDHLQAGVIVEVAEDPAVIIDEPHVHNSRELFDRLARRGDT